MDTMLRLLLREFLPDIENVRFEHIIFGHIHDTYLAYTGSKYIIQRINNNVFHDIPAMMQNIALFLKSLEQNQDYRLKIPSIQYTRKGLPFFTDIHGNYWRMYTYINNSQNYPKPVSYDNALEGGKILGHFTKAVFTQDPGDYKNILPGFHDIHLRWQNYQSALTQAPAERLKETGSDRAVAEKFYPLMLNFYNKLSSGKIPLRLTHNDTKFNNFLFDRNDKALSIIDLDTVMPGYTLYDYGDAIRTVGNASEEDERDSCNVRFHMKFFEAFTKGYLDEVFELLTEEEIKILPYAPLYITYLQGLRFLTDHFNGDVYYHVRYFGHNLIRAAVQFTLLRQMEDKLDFISSTINNYSADLS